MGPVLGAKLPLVIERSVRNLRIFRDEKNLEFSQSQILRCAERLDGKRSRCADDEGLDRTHLEGLSVDIGACLLEDQTPRVEVHRLIQANSSFAAQEGRIVALLSHVEGPAAVFSAQYGSCHFRI